MHATEFRPGQTVAFSQAVIRRSVDQPLTARARGTVVAVRGKPGISGPIVSVDWHGSWIENEDGDTVRHIPAINLNPVLAQAKGEA